MTDLADHYHGFNSHSRGKLDFTRSQGIVRGFLNHCSKPVKNQEILSSGCRKLFYYMFLYKQGNFVVKIS